MTSTRRRRLTSIALSAILLGGSVGLASALFASPIAQADSSLGGFTVTAVAEGSTIQYEQPNFPLPANPSLEVDEGYAGTTDNFGPTGTATASVLYPGQVVANAGTELPLLFPGLPLPAAPAWPIEAVSDFPQTPNTASSDEFGMTMETNSSSAGNTATAAFGDANPTTPGTGGGTLAPGLPAFPTLGGLLGLGGSGSGSGSGSAGSGSTNTNPAAIANPFLGIQAISSTSSSTAPAASAIATGTAIDTGVSILGGLIYLGTITSTATASSDGTTGTVTGSSTIANASIFGEPVTINSNGISAAGTGSPAIPISMLTSQLQQAGISITVTTATNTIKGPAASSEVDGVKISIDLSDLDNIINMFANQLPASVISQLPVAIPNKQILTIELADVTVSTSASPAFNFSADLGSTSSTSGGGSTPVQSSNLASGFSPSSTSSSPSSTGSSPIHSATGPTGGGSSVPAVFKGIGAGFVVLGALAALALMLASSGVNATTAVPDAAGAAGAGEDPYGGGEGYGDADFGDDPWDSGLALEPEGPGGG